ncbi:MAG: hypothetical protein ACM37W_20830 [Actinomycetota bacterium]
MSAQQARLFCWQLGTTGWSQQTVFRVAIASQANSTISQQPLASQTLTQLLATPG